MTQPWPEFGAKLVCCRPVSGLASSTPSGRRQRHRSPDRQRVRGTASVETFGVWAVREAGLRQGPTPARTITDTFRVTPPSPRCVRKGCKLPRWLPRYRYAFLFAAILNGRGRRAPLRGFPASYSGG